MFLKARSYKPSKSSRQRWVSNARVTECVLWRAAEFCGILAGTVLLLSRAWIVRASVCIVTGILGSSPNIDRRFRFKPWTGSWRQIPLTVNDLTGDKAGGVRAVKAFKSLSLDRTSIKCQVVGILRLGFSEWNPRLLSLWGHNWFSRSACERPLKMFI